MNLARYNRNVFPTLFNELWTNEPFARSKRHSNKGHGWAAVDVFEHEDVLHFEAELPGVKKDDVSVEFNDGVLSITGEKPATAEESEGTYFTRERHFGSFSRSFKLGRTYDPQTITAKFSDGVLSVTVGKKEESKPVSVEVN